MGGPMTPTDRRIPSQARPEDRRRPGSLGAICAFAALALACGAGGTTTRNAAERQPASPDAAPANPLPVLESLKVPAPDPARPRAGAGRTAGEALGSPQGATQEIDAQALRAADLYDAGKSPEAERQYGELLRRHPDHVASLVGMAQILVDRD